MDKCRKAGSMRYSRPVKSGYRSARSAMNLKKSSFLPPSSFSGHHDLVSRHMEAHYRRIVAARGKTDTSAPDSLKKCTKVKDQAKRLRDIRHSLSRHPSLDSLRTNSRRATQTPSQVSSKWWESDAGFVSMTQSLESFRLVDYPDGSEDDLGFQTREHDTQLPRPQRDPQGACGFEGIKSFDTENSPHRKETTTSTHPSNYRQLLESPLHEANKWQQFHTKTGQLTGYLHYKQRQTPGSSPFKGNTPNIPWKPAFSANSPQSHHSNYPSLGISSSLYLREPTGCISAPKEGKTGIAIAESRQTRKKAKNTEDIPGEATPLRGKFQERPQPDSSTSTKDGMALQEAVTSVSADALQEEAAGENANFLQSESCPANGQAEQKHNISLAEETDILLQSRVVGEEHTPGSDSSDKDPLPPEAATESLALHTAVVIQDKGKNILARTVELGLQSQVAEKRAHKARKQLEYQIHEYEYLNFISGVTRDILSRGVLSDSALALLFKSHIERNKHRLREDIMLEKIGNLKTDLGISS